MNGGYLTIMNKIEKSTDIKKLIKELSERSAVSGEERGAFQLVKDFLSNYTDEIRTDPLDNLIARRAGTAEDIKVMLAAHLDEIGLMVKSIDDNGFLKFATVGGIDPRTLPAQEVIVNGRKEITGVIGAMPPHLLSRDKRKKAHKLEDLYIDTGLELEEVKKNINIGDTVTIKRELTYLENDYVSGKALDDRAGVLMMLETARELDKIKHQADVYFVATSQEEVGLKGSETAAYDIFPDVGIAIDVCHGQMPGVDRGDASEMAKGPAVAFGPQVHPDIYQLLTKTAEERSIPYQKEASTTPYGTDAASIQIARSGVATALISIPLRYMHTSVEVISLQDVKSGAQLLARTIAEIDQDFLEGLTCY